MTYVFLCFCDTGWGSPNPSLHARAKGKTPIILISIVLPRMPHADEWFRSLFLQPDRCPATTTRKQTNFFFISNYLSGTTFQKSRFSLVPRSTNGVSRRSLVRFEFPIYHYPSLRCKFSYLVCLRVMFF